MKIPYYYNSGYADDGVEIYTCLQCGEDIHVRSHYRPNFCPYCGIKYKGIKENIGNKSKTWNDVCFVERYYWTIEKRTREIWDRWKEISYYRHDRGQTAKRILAEKRKLEKQDELERQKENEDFLHSQNIRREKDPNWDESKAETENPYTTYYEYRIVRKKEFRRHTAMVRKDTYLKKTGEELNQHQNRLPYGTKEEITTGLKFLPQMVVYYLF